MSEAMTQCMFSVVWIEPNELKKRNSHRKKTKAHGRRSAPNRNSPKAATPPPKAEWIKVEERDAEGRFVMPRAVVMSTANTAYDSAKHTDLKLRILKGYAPDGAIVGQYKVYDISLLSMKGWRSKVHVTVDLGVRAHEEAWFTAYKGQSAILVDPGLPNTESDEYKMTVRESSFEKKVVRVRTTANALPGPEMRVYEGNLKLVETWGSAYRRHKAELGKRAVIGLIAGVIGFAAKAILDEVVQRG